ncbi:helix-turn-helix domain-containing protein [Ancylobacter sp. A5.8]|uniref:helix-turn-helix domain-containing protein n=1 Tax=Ancylobacter gelatini TaxID=2919920 RepID=UPI001F4F09A2|nr:helix-turn-helix transcriptional regulator [Ancylobacter gelatini]MCJ8143833.1 helix-turn-helix domain-containing protein [Ancylobacter gelatini]
MTATKLQSPQSQHQPVDGFYLREWRRAKKVTLEALADRLGMHVTSVGNYETGKREPGAATIIRLAQALEISPGDFFRHPNVPSLDGLVAGLPETDRAVIAETVQALATSYRTRIRQND